ncbi:protease Do [Magnetococcus marinus MC-1]|uniref:Protease Do n=1 Tax=Magnetococcus marinus (strain ATCC BAA-1437 / JCM 17883 / MC-1) TaxID=156889 RepID=A0L512_MAGMM|nr:DegQ family serine endoprotease [Magnetococcus marinus]ABK43055.1 protease Do [Magnetococcus marinus MC-1]
MLGQKQKWRVVGGVLVGLALLLGSAPLHAGAWPVAVEGDKLPTLADMLERTTPGVVNIATSGSVEVAETPLLNDPFFRHFFDIPTMRRAKKIRSLGSGVVVDAAHGYILTNHHVIDKAQVITVTLHDGRALKAVQVGADPETDVAVIKVEAKDLHALPLGNSDILRVGDFVVAIGNPFGLGQTVTSGIVSALGRSGLGIKGYEDFIQTDASINPGNSGGALVNLRGELVGINTAILAKGGGNVGIGFAIPANMTKQLMAQLIEYGEVRRGLLGISSQDLTPELNQAFGLEHQHGSVVTRVTRGSAAQKAGLQAGDIITEVNGVAVRNAAHMRNLVGLLRVGEAVQLTRLRDGHSRTVKAVVEASKREQIEGSRLSPRLEGAVLEKEEQDEKPGVVVRKVVRGSMAARMGLQEGDRLLEVNQQSVKNLADMGKALAVDGRQMLLTLERGERRIRVMVR